MNTVPNRRPTWALIALATALGCAAPALAATQAEPSAAARYQRDRALCPASDAGNARADCLSEASTAYTRTQPSRPEESAENLARNAVRRCEPLREPDRTDCVARMQGQGTTSGSVAGGGIYRELVTREVETAPARPEAEAPPAAR
ncbi:MAG TPA: hypothetical protein VLI72_07990 [Methylibium sp.]|nr:hypothetical protein [Methylibium sp.]